MSASPRVGRRAIVGLFALAMVVGALVVVGARIPAASADPGAGTVIVQVSEPSGSYATGFCLQPGTLSLGGSTCGGTGSTQFLDFFPAGASVSRSLAAGTYNAGVGLVTSLTLGGTGVIEVVDGESITCTFSMTAAPVCAPSPGPDPGTVIVHVDEASGSFASGFCAAPGTPVLGSTICSDSRPTNIQFGLSAGSVVAVSMAPGSYSGALGSVGTSVLGPNGPVEVRSSQTLVCSFTLGAAPACTSLTGTVIVHVDESLSGDFAVGFCGAPGNPVLGSVICSDTHSLYGVFSLGAGESRAVSLPAGDFNAALALTSPLSLSPIGPIEVLAGQTTVCSFTMTAAPACVGAGDGDGVAEPPAGFPAAYDGNSDGTPDAEQGNVTSLLPAVGAVPVTVASPLGTALTNVTTGPVPGTPTPPSGVALTIGVLGFSVQLAPLQTSADVDVYLPAGSAPTGYYKLQGGAWVDFTSHVTIAGDRVTLHLVDGGAGDSDGLVNGVIVDPGGPVVPDYTHPTVTCPTPPTFWLNEAGASITATVTDAGSGPVAGSVTVSVPTGTVGPGSVSVTGSDLAGNTTTVSCAFSVTYVFTGFQAPVDNPPTVNAAKAGSNVPVKWRITDANGVGVSNPASFVSVTSNGSGCTGATIDAIEENPGNSGLQYLGNGNWQFNWKTPKDYGGQCRKMRLNLADGVTTRTADFKFK